MKSIFKPIIFYNLYNNQNDPLFTPLQNSATAHKVEVNAGFSDIDSPENPVEGTQKIFAPQFYKQLQNSQQLSKKRPLEITEEDSSKSKRAKISYDLGVLNQRSAFKKVTLSVPQ
jgi:hypothetical protein